MRVVIEAEPGEAVAKASDLLKAIARDLAPASPEARAVLEVLDDAPAREKRKMRNRELEALRQNVAAIVAEELKELDAELLAIHEEDLSKALYIGPRGGKWADPQHTIPWHSPAIAQGQRNLFEKEPIAAEPEKPVDIERLADHITNHEAATKSWKLATEALDVAHRELVDWEMRTGRGGERLNRKKAAAELDRIESDFMAKLQKPQVVKVGGITVETIATGIEQHAAEILHVGLAWKRRALANDSAREIKKTFDRTVGLHAHGEGFGTGRKFVRFKEHNQDSQELRDEYRRGIARQLKDAAELPASHHALFEKGGVKIRMLGHGALYGSVGGNAAAIATFEDRTNHPLILMGPWSLFDAKDEPEQGLTITHELGHIVEKLVTTNFDREATDGVNVLRMLREATGAEKYQGAMRQTFDERNDDGIGSHHYMWRRFDTEFLAEAYRYAYRNGGPMKTTLQHTDIDLPKFKALLDKAIENAMKQPLKVTPTHEAHDILKGAIE